jgi:purine-cytosine permease-like protein
MTFNDDGGNRFATITTEDHSAWIWLAVLHLVCYSICFLGFRVIIKLHRYGLDDFLLALAYVSIAISYDIRLLIISLAVRRWTLGYHFRLPLSSAWEVITRNYGRAIARCFQGTPAPFRV